MVLENFIVDAPIVWDRVGKKIFENPHVKQGRKMRVQITNAGMVEDLSGYALALGWKHTVSGVDGLDVFEDSSEANVGIFEMAYTENLMTNLGNLKASLVLTSVEDMVVAESNDFYVKVDDSPFGVDAEQGVGSFTRLAEILLNEETRIAAEVARVSAEETRVTDFNALVESEIIAQNVATKLQAKEAEYLPRLVSNEQQLAEADSKIKASTSLQMLQFTAKGKAFDATTEAPHCAWPYSKLHYDKDTSQFMFIYMAGQSHGVYQDKIYLRTKPVQGDWSDATLIADETANLQGCTCQAATITSDGRWLAIISKIVTATNEVLGAWLYVSNDKGATWTNSEIRIGGLPVTGRTGDVNALTQLESGRLIAWGWTIYGKSFVIYSDDVGETWAYGQVGQFDNIYDVFEPAFVELSNGTIIAILRDGWTPSDQLGADRPPRISKSFDGGITWSNPVLSTSIKDMNGNNGCFVHHKESKTVEFICCTRKPSADNQASIYQYVCTEEDAENDLFGERYRIGYGPDYLTDAGVQTTADFGYPAVAVSDDGYAMLMYYTGTKSATSFAYMMGSFAKTAYTQPELSTKSGNLIGYKGAGALVSRFVSPQTIPNNADTVLLFDTVAYDTDKIFNLALNPRRLYVPDGVTKVKISGNVQFAANATGGRTLLIRKNSETNFFGRPTVTIPTRTDGTATSVNITTPILQVVAGDWFELFVSQNSGGNLNVNSGYSTWMAMEIVQ